MNKIGLKLSLLAFVIFFAIAGGGCGGSGGGVQEGYNPDSDNDSGGGGVTFSLPFLMTKFTTLTETACLMFWISMTSAKNITEKMTQFRA
ncbi:MAG: hypothetical protein IJ697_07630 [Synergistaceae bacterium]|nr:hypothetical protein [Synergistaceae bacterium]